LAAVTVLDYSKITQKKLDMERRIQRNQSVKSDGIRDVFIGCVALLLFGHASAQQDDEVLMWMAWLEISDRYSVACAGCERSSSNYEQLFERLGFDSEMARVLYLHIAEAVARYGAAASRDAQKICELRDLEQIDSLDQLNRIDRELSDQREAEKHRSIQGFYELLDSDGRRRIARLPRVALGWSYDAIDRGRRNLVTLEEIMSRPEGTAAAETRQLDWILMHRCGPEVIQVEMPPVNIRVDEFLPPAITLPRPPALHGE
jgi:hypothetical protein